MPVLSPDIAFLINSGIDHEKLVRLALQAARLGVYPHQHILATGAVDENAYYAAFAEAHGLRFCGHRQDLHMLDAISPEEAGHAARAGIVRGAYLSVPCYIFAPIGRELMQMLERFNRAPALRQRMVITTPSVFREKLLSEHAAPLLQNSTAMLQNIKPEASAKRSFLPFVGLLLAVAIALVLTLLYRAPVFAPLFGLVCAMLYLHATALRVLAFADFFEPKRRMAKVLQDNHLPLCTVLVPLYKEGRIVPQLIAALRTLDYPHAKLDILILIEANDRATLNALNSQMMPPFMRMMIVPDGMPRTKPRALQVGLSFARGEMVTIFDAEDLPHPQQLRHAAAELHAGGSKLACVQAQLKIDNPEKSWLSQHFALEYAALFTVFLPALTRRGLPVLLGGTSNYFKTRLLRDIGGWDPWNVTEDADLGIRIARAGYFISVIDTPTEEEAPVTLRNWFMQRMRWQKGWMQTIVVHFSSPRALVRDLGAYKSLVLLATIGVSLISAFAYPLMVAWLAFGAFIDPRVLVPDAIGAGVFGLSMAACIGGHLFPYLHIAAGAKRARQRLSLWSLATVWVYWLLVSFAGYGALIGLLRSPYHWNKTEHFGRVDEKNKTTLFKSLWPVRRTFLQSHVPHASLPLHDAAKIKTSL